MKDVGVMKMSESEEIQIPFGGTIYHPNYITGFCMASRPTDWNKEMQPIIGRLFAIATILPNLKAGTIIDIAYGKRKVTWEDKTLTIHKKEVEEDE